MDDEALSEGFDRLVQLSTASAPSMADLEGRVAVRQIRKRRVRQRVALVGCAAAVAVAGFLATTIDPSPDGDERLTSQTATTVADGPTTEAVFTIARLPEDLAFRSCSALASETDPGTTSDLGGITCTIDNPATPVADGLRITRVIGGATDELQQAWDTNDAPASARASGGSDAPDDARFITINGTQVLDLGVGSEPSNDASAALRVLVGDDLVDLGATNVSTEDLGRIIGGLSMTSPSPVVTQALAALPAGSSALVQGERPLWVQLDQQQPEERSPFGGDTVGAELAVPGSSDLVRVDVTSDIDVSTFLDDLLATNDASLTETEIGGRRAIVLAPDAMLDLSVPEPRPGPQVFVQLDDQTLVRIADPGGSPAQVRAVAEAIG